MAHRKAKNSTQTQTSDIKLETPKTRSRSFTTPDQILKPKGLNLNPTPTNTHIKLPVLLGQVADAPALARGDASSAEVEGFSWALSRR